MNILSAGDGAGNDGDGACDIGADGEGGAGGAGEGVVAEDFVLADGGSVGSGVWAEMREF